LILQTSQRLAESKLHDVTVGIAHHCEISNDTAQIDRRLNQNVLLAGELRDPIDFFARVALKTEMIQTRLYFILQND
jgi:hypothetical protein